MTKQFFTTLGGLLILTSVTFSFYACHESTAQERVNAFTYATLDLDFDDASLSFKNLRIYPVRAKDNLIQQSNEYGKFVSLEQALQHDKIVIAEKSMNGQSSDEVNKLFAENISQDTIILLAGEIVKGGKQDRTLASDVVLPPGKGKIDLDVFCVEQGRWTEKDQNRVANQPMEEKKFKQTTAFVKPSVRKNATVAKEQTKVWQEVDKTNSKANNNSNTSAYTAFDENREHLSKEKEYLNFFKREMPNDNRIIGTLAVSGNKVIGCDIFATRQMFLDAWPKLLSSFINEAMYDGSAVTLPAAGVKDYTDRLLRNEKTQEQYLEQNGKLYKHNMRVMHLASY